MEVLWLVFPEQVVAWKTDPFPTTVYHAPAPPVPQEDFSMALMSGLAPLVTDLTADWTFTSISFAAFTL